VVTALPSTADLTTPGLTKAQFRTALANERDFLAGLLGTDGVVATALAALGTLGGALLTKTGAYTVTTADRGRVILATSGTWTLSLPAAASAGAGWSAVVANTGTGVVTIDPNGSETVDAAATVALASGRSAVLICTGTAWVSLALPGTAGGPVVVPAGSAAAPGLIPAGDTNTGLDFPAPDQIGLTTGGTRRILLSTTALQVSVPITGTAVTQSATDTTSGRLLKTRDFGIGVPSGTYAATLDLDTFASSAGGLWFFDNTKTNRPSNYGSALVLPYSTVRASVLAIAGDASEAFIGSLQSSNALPAWAKLWHNRNILATVYNTGGVPTGGLIERGSNANGEYVRFADGTQICTRTVTLSSGAGTTWTFPAGFTAAPVVSGSTVATVSSSLQQDSAASTTAVTLSARDKTDARRADSATLIAIGRWF
jgi:hypothetical protein